MMTAFFNRTLEERAIIDKAIAFELKALEECSEEPNPYILAIKSWVDYKITLELINIAVDMAYMGYIYREEV